LIIIKKRDNVNVGESSQQEKHHVSNFLRGPWSTYRYLFLQYAVLVAFSL
jgi:hypothetical protein